MDKDKITEEYNKIFFASGDQAQLDWFLSKLDQAISQNNELIIEKIEKMCGCCTCSFGNGEIIESDKNNCHIKCGKYIQNPVNSIINLINNLKS